MITSGTAADMQWHTDAVIYQLHVKTFFDSNGDGIGDFAGLTRKLDYLQRLGVSCLWLLPFYESPLRDDGYDISHYERVHPAYGAMRDFRRFLDEAHGRGLKVITELVINHTSDRHPWFQAARRAAPGSAKRDFYVWSDTADRYAAARVIFSDTERSNWTWDPVAHAFYWHRFFHHQPDLNFDNPRVRRAVLKVMCFWLDLGVDGLRLDAVAHLFEREGTTCDNLPETHAFLREIRREMDARYQGRVLVAEANHDCETMRQYFGNGDECQMAFHFPLMPRLFVALTRGEAAPIIDVVERTNAIPPGCQWATFLRNHDELTLSSVTDQEREWLVHVCAPDPGMRLHGGIRRRLAPLLGNQRRTIELAYALLLSLPGSPVIYYGDEIAMGDDVRLPDRDGVRTPMQWSDDVHGGFSDARAPRLVTPVIDEGVYGYRTVNVASQMRDPESLLARLSRLLYVRRSRRAFGRGSMQFLATGQPAALAFVRRYEDEAILVAANLSSASVSVALNLPDWFVGTKMVEIVDDVAFPAPGPLPYQLSLGPYASYWFQCVLVDSASPYESQVSGGRTDTRLLL
jgi:maltose alpha-D-glucosyltransferase/alpha-amylase